MKNHRQRLSPSLPRERPLQDFCHRPTGQKNSNTAVGLKHGGITKTKKKRRKKMKQTSDLYKP
ncbi:MAG: hypothetical protein MJ077_02355 [Oscillospiraceae bacterium]|nr:hypothetical protein [Oscillospiraceae bacterium]